MAKIAGVTSFALVERRPGRRKRVIKTVSNIYEARDFVYSSARIACAKRTLKRYTGEMLRSGDACLTIEAQHTKRFIGGK